MVLFPLTGGIQEASAAENGDNVQITLHKLLFEEGDLPELTQNDGKTNPFGTENPQLLDFIGLNDVTFEVYDVSEDYYRLIEEGVEISDIKNQLAQATGGTKVGEGTTKRVGEEDGILEFSLSRNDAEGNFKVYRFVEVEAPAEYVEEAGMSEPLIVALPVFDENDQELTSIHLYPKNEQVPHDTPDLEKEVATDHSDFELGAEVPYELITTIPYDVWTYQRYALQDKGANELTFNPSSLNVTIDGTSFSDYTLTSETHGFTLEFSPGSLRAFSGKKLKVNYTMTLNDATQETIENEGILYPGDHDIIKDKTIIYTGGKEFIKVDRRNQSTTLQNAKFVLRNLQGEYLLQKDGKNQWLKVTGSLTTVAKDLTVLTSDAKGLFKIQGLAYGDYELLEVAAPKHYILSKEAISFKVNGESFPQVGVVPLKVVNEPDPAEPPHGNLPQTGEMVVRNLSFVGLGLIILALTIYLYKNKGMGKVYDKKNRK